MKTTSLSWSGAHPSRRSCWYDDDGGDDGGGDDGGGDDGGGDNVGGGDAKQNNNEDLPGTKLFSSKFLHLCSLFFIYLFLWRQVLTLLITLGLCMMVD